MLTLLVDGDNLLTIGFYGVKNYFYKGQHIGGIYHFLNTLRLSFDNYRLDKIVVFWDGKDGSAARRKIYSHYKESRKSRLKTEHEIESYDYQRNRIKQYLEEVYVRQGEYPYCETDDCIAHYCQSTPGEKKIVYSSDGDMAQLVNDKVQLYNPSHRKLYGPKESFVYDKEEVLIENISLVKMLCGDYSDDIAGIKGMGIKTLTGLFPEIETQPLTLDYVRYKTNFLFEQDKESKIVKNLITGVTKYGVFGDEFFDINNTIVSLDDPFLTEEAKEGIHEIMC
ncbi:MAG: hypothetical protein E4H21_10750 [Thermodesulfobacteriales bacterium]|nr:MAG: hypothetical protein E4H21_10750 [Thermodesulfobacteriales bacterium]